MSKAAAALLLVFISVLPATAAERFAKPAPVQLTSEGRRWVSQTMKKMSLEEKVGQMFSVRYFMDFQNLDSDAYRNFRDQMQKYHLGSVVLTVHVDGHVLLKSGPLDAAAMANQLQRDSRLPLLIAADFERGLAMRMDWVPLFPDAMAFGATGKPEYTERFGEIAAEESRAVGVQWDFYPIVDVNMNPANPVINVRSYGEDPQMVGDMAAAFIKGARSHGMLTTAKHFPGHGDTGTDSHLGVAQVSADPARLQAVELPPFRKAISADVDSVMVAHVTVPALEPDPNKVATTSQNVIAGVLRKQLGFQGAVVTDALEMRGLTRLYPPQQQNPSGRAAVDAVKAGNDVLLLPSDLDGAYRGVLGAVKSGEIPESRIDESVRRILEMKASVGLNKARLVDLEQVPHLVSRQGDMDFAQQVADDAVTMVRDNGQVLPLAKYLPPRTEGETYSAPVKPDVKVVTLIFSDSARGLWGRSFETALRARRADATVFYIDPALATPLAAQILQAVKDAGKVIAAVYLTPITAKQVMIGGKLTNTVGLEPVTGDLFQRILDLAASKTAVIALGNPYLLVNYPSIQNYFCTFSAASSSELSAVKVLFGELQPHGHLPVSLPGIAPRGFAFAPSPPQATGH